MGLSINYKNANVNIKTFMVQNNDLLKVKNKTGWRPVSMTAQEMVMKRGLYGRVGWTIKGIKCMHEY